jgi:hypothetical protein
MGYFADAVYLSSNYYFNGSQNNDTAALGQALIVVQASAGSASKISFNTSAAGSTTTTTRASIDADGLKFNGDTAAANALDDYEEGTWSATITPGTSGTITPSTNACRYTKIGRQVYIQGLVTAGSISSPVGSKITIGNLPFTIGGATVNDGRFSPTTIFSQAALSYAQTLLPSQGVGTRTEFDCQINASTIAVNDEFCFSAIYTV